MTRRMAVIKLGLQDENKRRKAFTIISGFDGVDAVALRGAEKELIVVEGVFDSVALIQKLRKQLHCKVNLDRVAPVEEQANRADEYTFGNQVVQRWPENQYYYAPYSQYPAQVYEIRDDYNRCSIL